MNLGTLGFAIRVIVMLLVVLFVVLGVSGNVRKWLKRILKGEKTEEEW
jgi:RNase P/RNase MRP subunit POP5